MGKKKTSLRRKIQTTEKKLPESVRFIYRTSKSNGVKFYLVTIPKKEFEFFKQVDVNYYTRHDHRKCDPTRFRDLTTICYPDFLLHSPRSPFSDICPVGKNIYYILSVFGEPLEFWSYSLDPHHADSPKQLAPPNSENRYSAYAFSLRGKVYLCAGLIGEPDLESQPFAEVYDPVTNTWSSIPRPPNSDALICKGLVFVASLGESNAKILVYDYHDSANDVVYIYDVATRGWTTHPLAPPKDFEPRFAYIPPVFNKDDNLLYWIDERRGFMYALDWEKMKLYSGPVVGMEYAKLLSNLKTLYHALSLNHLWGDYFCLVWSRTRPPTTGSDITENHFTFIKVVKYPPEDILEVFVLGCFVDFNHDRPPRILDSICI